MKKFLLLMLTVVIAFQVLVCSQQAEDETATEATDSDWAYIQDKGVLTIGVTNYPPMNYLDDNGEWTGFDTEFAQAVCESLGIKAEFVEISWEAKETELASKNIDVLWNGMCITEDRKEMWEVTKPYM